MSRLFRAVLPSLATAAGALFFTATAGCGSDCEIVTLPACGIRAPQQVAAGSPFTVTVTYELSGCLNVHGTSHTQDATTITVRGEGKYCCKDCSCGLGIEAAEHPIPSLDPGTYVIRVAPVANQTCNATRDGPTSAVVEVN